VAKKKAPKGSKQEWFDIVMSETEKLRKMRCKKLILRQQKLNSEIVDAMHAKEWAKGGFYGVSETDSNEQVGEALSGGNGEMSFTTVEQAIEVL